MEFAGLICLSVCLSAHPKKEKVRIAPQRDYLLSRPVKKIGGVTKIMSLDTKCNEIKF